MIDTIKKICAYAFVVIVSAALGLALVALV